MLRALTILTVSVAFLPGCAPRLRVGVVLPETGEAAAYGASIKTGVLMALADLSSGETSLRHLEVIWRDSGSSPARAASATESLLEQDSRLVIGGATSAEARAMIPVAERWRRVILSPSASAPWLARETQYFFRVFPSDDAEGVAAADYLLGPGAITTVVVIAQDNEYSRGLLPVFVSELRSRGGQVVATVDAVRAGDESAVRTILAAGHPEAAYVCGYHEFIVKAVRVLRAAGFSATVCTTSAVHTSGLLQGVGRDVEDVVFPLAGFDESNTRARSFLKRYRASYGMAPDIYAGHGYDAGLAAGLALARTALDANPNIRAALHSLDGRDGVMGALKFDDYGNVRHALRMYQIHNGRVVLLARPTGNGTT
jgi:branched-chain amino acid transport system substrate-binding protein